MNWLKSYLAGMSGGILILWCYAIWYLVVLICYFEPSAHLWLTSFGIGVIVANALYISTAATGKNSPKLNFWQIFRFFLVPFAVSSFSALVKGRGFVLVFSPRLEENAVAFGLCIILFFSVWAAKRMAKRPD